MKKHTTTFLAWTLATTFGCCGGFGHDDREMSTCGAVEMHDDDGGGLEDAAQTDAAQTDAQ